MEQNLNPGLALIDLSGTELKREVERGSTDTLTSDLSCIAASILFANVNFTHVRA